MRKRVLSGILAIIMLFSLLPINFAAAGAAETPLSEDGGNIPAPADAAAENVVLKKNNGESDMRMLNQSESASTLAGRTVSILGDSISTYTGVSNDATANSTIGSGVIYYTPGKLDVYREDTWWQQTVDALELELLVNNSWSGSAVLNTRSGAPGAYIDRCVQLHNDHTGQEPDVIVVFMGTNDYSWYQSTLGTSNISYTALISENEDGSFTYAKPKTTCEAYAVMLHKMIRRYPQAEIYCMGMLSRRDPDEDGKDVVPAPTQFNAELKTVIEHFACRYVDVESAISPDPADFDLHIGDKRVHPNAAGMDRITEALLSVMLGREVTLCRVSGAYTGVSTDNTRSSVLVGGSYSATLTPVGNNTELQVTVTMGGEDVTASCYGDGVISIAEVTGDIEITAGALAHAVPRSEGVQNAIDRAYALTDVEWTPLADVPGVKKVNGEYTVIPFRAGVTYRGIPYSGVTANDCYVGLNVSLESFLTALKNENSVLYTENLFSTNPKAAPYFGTVCSKFAQYVLHVPGMYNTNNVANIPGMQTVALPGEYTVDQIKLGDVVLNTASHTAVCTDILYDADGNAAYIEISEAVMPLLRRQYWSAEEFCDHFASFRLCRYQYVDEVPPVEAAVPDTDYALMPRFGNKYNYKVSTAGGVVDVLADGYSKAVVLRDGEIVSEIELNGASSFSFDRSVPGYLEMYLETADGTRSGSVYACVVSSSISVTDCGQFALGRLTVAVDGSSGTPLYVQVGSTHAVFCSLEGQDGTVELSFPVSLVSNQKVRVAYRNEYGVYFSSWKSFTAVGNPSADPLLSQGQFWNGYNLTPTSPNPVIQSNHAGYWTYTMVPVRENTTYYSVGATRMWFLDQDGEAISTYNAYQNSEAPFRFTTPAGTAFVSIAYAPGLVEQGTETLEHIHTYENGVCVECGAAEWDVDGDGVLEILALGNSFSVDALEYVWQIAQDLGIEEIVIGNLKIGGCTLATHAANAAGDLAKYTYYYNDNGTWTSTNNYKISTALESRSWDYVSLQQGSAVSGVESSYNEDLTNLIAYVKERSDAKLVWHMTWAYQQDSTHSAFPTYDSDQMTMYHAIVSAVQNKIVGNDDVGVIVPNGTAVQNSRTSLLGDTTTRDGYHMSYGYGRYLTGLMFVKALTGLSVDSVSFKPSGVDETEQLIAVESVNHAFASPFAVTQSAYTDAHVHNWDNGILTVTPTGTADGTMRYTCTVCGETRTETVPATGESAWYVLEENDSDYTLHFVGSGAVTQSLWLHEEHLGEITQICVPAAVTSLPEDILDGLPHVTTVVAPYNSEIYRAAADAGLTLKFSALRILVLGNSHSSCFMQNFNTIVSDLKNAGLQTTVSYDRISHGNRSIGTTDNQHLAHLEDAAYDKLRTKTYDLVVIQDFRESTSGLANYPELIQSAVTALKSYQPGAQIAVFADWNSSYATSQGGFASLEESYAASLRSIAAAEGIADFIIDAATPFMNARTALAEGTIFNDSNHVFTTPGYALSGNIFAYAVFHHFCEELYSAEKLDYFTAVKTYQGKTCDFKAILNSVKNATEHPGTVTLSAADCHVMATVDGYAATCEESGRNTYYTCSICGRSFRTEDGTAETAPNAEVLPALGHDWQSVVTAPTCTEQGYTTHTCTRCGDSYVDSYTDAMGHDIVTDTAVAPTCTEAGLTAGEHCSRCDYKVAQETVPALGHDLVTDAAVAPTCTEPGLTEGTHCTRCDYKVAQETVPALGHNLVTDAAVAPTCTETGLTEGTHCTRCDYKVAQEVVPALGHDLVTDAAVAPTCTETGLTEGTHCTRCDYKVAQETVPALGHDLVTDAAVAPTCTETGLTEGSHCTRCDYKIAQTVVPAWGHDIVIDNAVAPTCTATGLTAGEHCTRCDYKVAQTVVPALGHDIVIDNAVAPTCTATGLTAGEHCTRCDYKVVQETVPALGHDLVTDAAIAPTCTETGLTAGEHCTRCDYKAAQETIAALGHDLVTDVAVAPTCTETGLTEGSHCTRCDYKVAQETVPALSHDLVPDVAVAPTCTETGLTEGTHCTRCDYKVAQETVPALGHDLVTDAAIAPTCTETGLTAGEHCTRCDYKVAQEVVSALGHDLVTDAAVAPTCTEPGLTEGTHCTRCDYKVAQETVPALGHDLVTDAAVAPTCTETGLTEGNHCTRCDYKVAQETVPALGHDLVTDVAVAPTCTETGLTEGTHCTRCDYKVAQEVVPALGHDLVTDVAVAPTCTETGLTEGSHCTRCDYKVAQETVPALGHDLVTDAAVAPTCTETGMSEGTHCTRCDYKVAQEVVDALGHDLVTDAAVVPTCTETGLTEGSHCTRCNYKVAQETVSALGHVWDDGKLTTQPTATKDGVKTFTCTRCGATRTETIPATGEDKPCDGGPTCPSYKFTDVKAGDWFHEAVDFAVKNGLFNGMSETTFEPNTPMTRGMLVTVLWRYEGQPEGGVNQFADVKDGVWYAKAVAWAASKGIVNGVAQGKFDPNGRITREQMAAILYRYSEYKTYNTGKRGDLTKFPDASKVSAYANDAIAWAVGEGLIGGNVINGKTLLDPQGNATRAQVATILMRFIQNVAQAE